MTFRDQGETSPTHSDSLSALIPQNISTGTGYKTGPHGVDTGLGRDLETLSDRNYSHLQGLDSQNFCEKLKSSSPLTEESRGTSNHFCEKLESSSSLTEETQITSQEVEIIKKVGSYPANPVEIPEPLPDVDLSQPANPVPTPYQPRANPD